MAHHEIQTYISLLQDRSNQTPDKKAFTFLRDGEIEAGVLTFAQLDQQARAIAQHLKNQGAAGRPVLLLYPSGLDFVSAFFGCLYAGAIAVPAYPPRRNRADQRILSIIRDAGIQHLLTNRASLPHLEKGAKHLAELRKLVWITSDDLNLSLADSWQTPDISGESLAFLQYTSGSTATPKGVMVSHANLIANERMMQQAFAADSNDVYVTWAPLYHDMGLIGNILQSVFVGASSYLMSPVAFWERPIRWLNVISKYGGTMAGGPNFAYDRCLQRISAEERAHLDLSTWRIAANGAEPIKTATVTAFCETFGPQGFAATTFYPCYGLAEATLFVTGGDHLAPTGFGAFDSQQLEQGIATLPPTDTEDQTHSVVNCGAPFDNSDVTIVNPESHVLCEPGHVGEIWVRGPHIAKGYWQRPEETKAVFEARYQGQAVHSQPYMRTGDLGFLHENDLFVTGRLKDLIIFRGRNIYPQDLEESSQRAQPWLQASPAAAFTIDEADQPTLVIVQEIPRKYLREDISALPERIRQFVARDHDVRADIVILTKPMSIPKTSSGKIQRGRCRQLFRAGSLAEVVIDGLESSSPTHTTIQVDREQLQSLNPDERLTALQTYLRQLVAKALGIRVSLVTGDQPLDQFGLDSLQMVTLQHQLEQDLTVQIALTDLLTSESIDQLVSLIDQQLGESAPQAATIAIPDDQLSMGQRAMWFLQQLSPESAAYSLVRAAKIHGSIDITRLEAAFQSVIQRHPSLRANFHQQAGNPIVVTRPDVPEFFSHFDASTWSEATLKEALHTEALRPFDLATDALIRVRVYHRDDEQAVLFLAIHHIISDLWSFSLLLREVSTMYAGGTELPVQLPQSSYAHYVHQQQQMLADERGQDHWSFWQEQLQGSLPVLEFPTDFPRPATQTHEGAIVSQRFEPALSKGILEYAKRQGCTPYITMLTAFQVFAYRFTGQRDLIIGSPYAGRDQAAWSEVIGYFVNPMVIRGEVSPFESFQSLLQSTRDQVMASLAHANFPFVALTEKLQPERDLSRHPIFSVMFSYQTPPHPQQAELGSFALGEADSWLPFGDLVLESLPLDHWATQVDLTLMVTETDGSLRATFEYNRSLFQAATIERMMAHFQALLESILAAPSQPIHALQLQNQREKRLLEDWNQTDLTLAEGETIHGRIARQAVEQANRQALVFDHDSLTYAELNKRSDRVAAHLRQQGIEADQPVGLCMPRSLDMMVGLLGILKSGGAYVPMDPTYPQERLDWIIADSGMKQVITGANHLDLSAHSNCRRTPLSELESPLDSDPIPPANADQLAYVIYTSGSTGKPKGVCVSHRNALNFFAAMDQRIGCSKGDTLLALTSISFDISILELFWTLCNGARVILLDEHTLTSESSSPSANPHAPMAFSLFYFASEDTRGEKDTYRLLRAGAEFADREGFAAVWTPERHFHPFGGKYPNPAMTSAYVAGITERIGIRAGSVVLPLHDPVRVAEEWSMADNMSNGRVSIAVAPGWHANDYVLMPNAYDQRKDVMMQSIETLQKLWRGETITRTNGSNKPYSFQIFPRPIQEQLPIWITSGGNRDTFVIAGKMGAHLLTHLLGQSPEEVGEKIQAYREALAEAGFDPQSRKVSLMLHTFVGEDMDTVHDMVREPFRDYLRSSIGLIRNLAKNLDLPYDLDHIQEGEMEQLLDIAFERYSQTSALFGTVASCQQMVQQMKAIGVDEIACLIDFGVDEDRVIESLSHLKSLQDACQQAFQQTHVPLAVQAKQYQPTLMQATPSTMVLLTANPQNSEALASLRTLMLGGEALPPSLANEMGQSFAADLHNMYGPTETTIWSTTDHCDRESPAVTIGTPIANTQVHILDEFGQQVPIGVSGELTIGGFGLARGYHQRPALTALRFIPDAMSQIPGQRVYRTGDLARWNAQGKLEHLGRLDFQVKLRGHRIELGEIEAVLSEHDAIEQAVAMVRSAPQGPDLLVAYVITSQLAHPNTDLRAYLSERLPAYMVPAHYVVLPEFPLTLNGKIDRKALPMPVDHPASSDEYEAPANAVEEILAGIWAQVLGLQKVGRNEHFFHSGGHSLAATQMVARIREVFGVNLPLKSVFEHPSIASLVPVIDDLTGSLSPDRLPPLETYDIDSAILPLSFAQQRLWVLDQLEPENRAYNHSYAVFVDGHLDGDRLSEALNHLIMRNESLRTVFATKEAEPIQVILPTQTDVLTKVDLTHFDETTQATHLQADTITRARLPFDLAKGPMLRATLYQLDSDRFYLMLTVHFIAADGWSMEILVRDLLALYSGQINTASEPASSPRRTYVDYAVWQRRWWQDETATNQIAYWRKQLADAPVLSLPLDHPRPKRQTSHGATQAIELSAETVKGLRDLCRQNEVTLFMGLLSAYAVLLNRYTRQDDLVIGSPLANRPFPELEQCIGCFVNNLPFRVDLSGSPDFTSLLARVRETTLAGYAHQDIPFEVLVQEIEVERDLSRTPLFQTMLILQKSAETWNELDGLQFTPSHVDQGTSKYELTLDLSENEDSLHGIFEYSTDLFEPETIARMASHFSRLVTALIAEPNTPIAALPILSENESTQLLVDWNQTDTAFDQTTPIHHQIEAWAQLTPSKQALVAGTDTLTYADLDRRANRLAHYLLAQNLGEESPVGICLDRSLEMAVAMLAVLKAGRAYVPMDPAYPQARLTATIQAAKMSLLLTHSKANLDVAEERLQLVAVDSLWEASHLPVDCPKTTFHPEQLAYVIFTSGSTGTPKGVPIPHRALKNFILTMLESPGIVQEDVLLSVTTPAFDIMGLEFFGPLAAGAQIVLCDRMTAADGPALRRLIDTSSASMLQATPATWQLLVDAGWTPSQHLKVLCGGDSLPLSLARQLTNDQGAQAWNMYGPTETTIWSTTQLLNIEDPWVLIGSPIANTQIYLLDDQGQPVPIGVPGNLFIGGTGVARGYWSQPSLTATSFVPNPFAKTPGERMYATGDLARYRADGRILFLGRKDFQVKIRGYRIELGEIEHHLGQADGVETAIASVRPGPGGELIIVAFYTTSDSQQLDPQALSQFLSERLPAYMVPAAYLPLTSVPLTQNGKINRKALPQDTLTNLDSGQGYRAPTSNLEKLLTRIWKSTLNLERIGIDDGFFTIGGNSLLATRIAIRVQETLKIKLPLHVFFEATTIAKMAQVMISRHPNPAQLKKKAAILERIKSLTPEQLRDLRNRQQSAAAREANKEMAPL